PSHRVRLLEESLLSSLAEGDAAIVNSHHHQAIDSVGRHLVATAWTSDGLVEALEDPRSDRFVMAVQWHPELGWQKDRFSQSLFQRFIKEADRYAHTSRRDLNNSEAVAKSVHETTRPN
ncbi:MAG: gamma-glutamyl-gamma-aminobutyrate hydrolase family protein, partial [Pyrinomonadaceae bacterium]